MRRDDWLSEVVLRDCWILEESEVAGLKTNQFSQESFYTCRILDQSLKLQNTLLDLGFRLIVTEVELLGTIRAEKRSSQRCVIRRALPSDQGAVEDIASTSFRYDRFHVDSLIESYKADLIKRLWVASSFQKTSSKDLWVAEFDGIVAGFCLAQSSREWTRIDLIAVAPRFQGIGVGSALVKSLPGCYRKNSSSIRVGTQEKNQESIHLYRKCGMNIDHKRSVYHRGFF